MDNLDGTAIPLSTQHIYESSIADVDVLVDTQKNVAGRVFSLNILLNGFPSCLIFLSVTRST